jgi:hypothetical protein
MLIASSSTSKILSCVWLKRFPASEVKIDKIKFYNWSVFFRRRS